MRKIKKKTSITIDENLVKQAKDNKLNMSALAEEAIKNALNETSNLQRLKIRKTKLKQQIEQNTIELERVEDLIEMEVKAGKYKFKQDNYNVILGLVIIGLIGLLTFPFGSNTIISTTLTDDFIVEYKGEGEVIVPNWLGTTELGDYSFQDNNNISIIELINPSYLIIN